MSGFLFAGQGAQYIGMGKDLWEEFPISRSIFETVDKIVGFELSKLCFEGPLEQLTLTQNCQPAILTVSIAALEACKSVLGSRFSVFEYGAGLSLGEYSALVAAEAIDFRDAVYLVRRRGELMEEAGRNVPGGMLSIIGLDVGIVREISSQTQTQITNINCPGQVVISGGKKEIGEAQKLAQAKGARRAIVLEVSGAFHSTFMQEAARRLFQELSKIKISMPKVPVVSNVTAKPFVSIEEIRDNLVKQVASCVLWEDSMRFILSRGVSMFIEFGPGKVLKGLMRQIEPSAQVQGIESKADIIKLLSCVKVNNSVTEGI